MISRVSINLDTGEKATIRASRRGVDDSFPFDFLFVTDSGFPEPVLEHQTYEGIRRIAILDEQAFATIDRDDIDTATFGTAKVIFPLESDDTIILQTDTGAYYKIGNAVYSNATNLVDFDYELLVAGQSLLILSKTSDIANYSVIGDTINYSYQVSNSGATTITGPVTVSDSKVTVVCPAVNTVGNGDDMLNPGEKIICTASHSVAQADIDAGSIMNTATASGGGNVTSNQDQLTVTYLQVIPVLTLDKSSTWTLYQQVGSVINYNYKVRNAGTVPIAGPIAVDDDREIVSCPAVNTVGNSDDRLDPGESVNCTASHTIVQADLDNGTITNIATASGDGGSAVSSPDQVTVKYILAAPLLVLKKTADVSTFSVIGDVIHYSYKVTNSGNYKQQGAFGIFDNKVLVTCPDLNTIGNKDKHLDPGETSICIAAYTVVQADIDAGSITNIAYAIGNAISNQEQVTVNWIRSDMLFESGFEQN